MKAAQCGSAWQGILRYSRWDALLVALAGVHGALLWAAPVAPVVALGVWWNSNTIAHNHIHTPFFRVQFLNRLFALYLSLLLGIPQSIWRGRHLAHHAGTPWRPRLSPQLIVEVSLVFALWALLLTQYTHFFLCAYLPGYLAGLGLCWLHGYYEHCHGTVSHHGWLYNRLFFNDGFHSEHHARPGLHWTVLPQSDSSDAPTSRWPAVLRWLDVLSLESLEKLVLRSLLLQRMVVQCHETAFRRLLPSLPPSPRIAIVGGGLFPRTPMILQRLIPDGQFVVIDRSADNIDRARAFLTKDVQFWNESYEPRRVSDFDLVVFPLAFDGDRAAIYHHPPASWVLVHDWLWRRRGTSTIISLCLFKRLNRVKP
ncbi:MAG TPA: fatty acid desaturase [Gemmataceae bacterium]|jgi:hypothetical protein